MERYHTKLCEDKELMVEQYLVRGGSYQLCWHKAVELLVVLKGEVEAYVDGELKQLQKDDLLLINSNCVHSLFVKDPGSIFLVIEIHPGYLKKFPEFRCQNLRIDFSSNAANRFNPFISMIRYYCAETFSHSMREGKLEARMAEQYLGVLLYELIAKFGIVDENFGVGNDRRQHEALQIAMDYMEENYDSPISLEQVAQKTKYNRTYISTLFKSSLGLSFRDYLVRVRLRHAIEQIAETDKPILQIAMDCGFSNVNALTNSIKKYCGKNPQEYRDAFKAADERQLYALNEDNKYLPYPNAEAERLLLGYKEKCFTANDMERASNHAELQAIREHSEKILRLAEAAIKKV